MAPQTSHHLLPPFAEGITTAPLVSIKFSQLEADEKDASAAFFKACKELGFFYLDMLDSALGEEIVTEAEQINTMQQDFFKMPNDVKDKYGRPHLHPFYAYRYNDLDEKDESGVPIRAESYNLRKDDVLGLCERLDCPPIVLQYQKLFKSYALHCRRAIDILLEHLNTHLELLPGTLANLHRIHERSGDHIRLIQAPPSEYNEARAQKAAHTDFGSITVLFNWLGGLQIRTPDTEEWVWVRPIPGSCVVNLGDAMVKFTAGLLRSNIHRVVPPLGEQAGFTRNSLVFFSRPEDSVVLRRLKGGLIDSQPIEEDDGEGEMTAHEWIMAKGTGQRPGVYTLKKGFEWKENEERLKGMASPASGTPAIVSAAA